MSKRQMKKFQKQGFVIEGEKKGLLGRRTKPTKITFPSVNGEKPVTVTNPNELRSHLLSSPAARGQMRTVFNPRFASLSDSVASKVFGRFKTSKAKKIKGDTDKERDKNLNQSVAGEKANIDADGKLRDENGKEYVIDENGKRLYEKDDPDKFKDLAEKQKQSLGDMAKEAASPKKATGGVLKAGLKGVSALGAADTACTVYNLARAVAAAAKNARAMQLAQVFVVAANEADEIKQGTATPEDAEYLGKKLTSIDMDKMIPDDKSDKQVPNPYYQKNALDSPGYHMVAYNDAPTLTSRDTQYTVGGGLVGELSGIMNKIEDTLHVARDNIQSTCHVVQSWWVRGVGLTVGLISAVGSFGTSTAISIGASVAIGFAIPFLKAQLADIVGGKVVSAATVGVDLGDAIVSGGGAFLGTMAQFRGLMPASAESMKAYLGAIQPVKDQYVAMEKYEAQKTPFDVMNQYSFLGSAVRMINPTLIKSTASISGALTNLPSLLTVAFSGIVPHVNADIAFNPERFKKCVDDGYRRLGIDADVFCNVRFQMQPAQLNADPDDIAKWMIDQGHIEEDGTPKSEDYKKWIEYCAERKDGWGETSKDDNINDWDTGKECMKKNDENFHFPVFYLDKATNDGMDSPPSDGQGNGETAFTLDPASDDEITNMALAEMYP